ncbi:MAG: alkaline phosphatase [Kiritimatiellae bacterium]|nr:alkaline phosphatase [Kiritimatiellia bacterium]
MKRTSLALSVLLALPASVLAGAPKYVFLFIGDGMSTPQRMVTEEFARKCGLGDLAMNHLPYQSNTRTISADAIITDSAASGTAIACGKKTKNGMLGVDPAKKRVSSVAEVAKRRGMKVGIVTTVTIVHATPAAFYSHLANRGRFYRIALDLVGSGFDYFAGGGVYDKFDDRKDPDYRGNVFDLARKAGYAVTIDDRAAWAALRPGGKSWSVFGHFGMNFAIDADGSEPTLAELLAKGVELLDGPQGFFMMCEGGKVDYACHANDAATNIRDILALDDAVKAALAFQERHPDETLVVTTGDHETGGLSMGFAGIGGKFRVEMLANQKVSTESFSSAIKKRIRERLARDGGDLTIEEVKPMLREAFGFVFPGDGGAAAGGIELRDGEVRQLRAALAKDVSFVRAKRRDTTAHDVARIYVFAQTAKNVLNARAGVGWSSGSHTALPTFTTAKGPGADILVGMDDNADIGLRMKRLLETP